MPPWGRGSMPRRYSAFAPRRAGLSCQHMPRPWWAGYPARGRFDGARPGIRPSRLVEPALSRHRSSAEVVVPRALRRVEFDGTVEFARSPRRGGPWPASAHAGVVIRPMSTRGRARWRGGTRPSPRRTGPCPARRRPSRVVVHLLRGEFDTLAGGPDRLVHLAVLLQGHADAEAGPRPPSATHRQAGHVEAHRLRAGFRSRSRARPARSSQARSPPGASPCRARSSGSACSSLSQHLRQEHYQRGRRPALGCPLV